MKHFVIYIHGITIKPTGNSHKREYQAINKELEKIAGNSLVPVYTEWGHTCNQLEIGMFDKVNHRIKPGFISIPGYDPLVYDLRQLLIFGISDAFYYCTPNGEEAIREAIFSCVIDEINNHLQEIIDEGALQFSLVTHSLGSIIGYDFLFNAFGKPYLGVKSNTNYTTQTIPDFFSSISYDKSTKKTNWSIDGQEIELKLRNFVTMGSPILLTLGRNEQVKKDVENSTPLKPELLGLVDPSSQRWLNIWDKQDFLGFPLDEIFENRNKIIFEPDVDTGILFTKPHTNYFESADVQKAVMDYGYW